jgi:hypothetical protein
MVAKVHFEDAIKPAEKAVTLFDPFLFCVLARSSGH